MALRNAFENLSTEAKQDLLLAAVGEPVAVPAANTALDRLRVIAAGVTTLAGHVDGLEGLATALNAYVDGLETLQGTTNTTLAAMAGYVDGIETLQGTTNATLSTLNGFVDGLEGLLAGVATETKLEAVRALLAGTLTTRSPQATVTETRVVMTGSWVKVWTAGAAKRLIIALASDSGASGDYSFDSGLTGVTAGGVPFSSGAGGSFDFAGGSVPNTDLYVKATNGSAVTVQVFN